ncbi:MAG: PilZ domain-containing protein [Myxococcota bacterium]
MTSREDVLQAALGRAREARSALEPVVERVDAASTAEVPEPLREALARVVGALYATEIGDASVVRDALDRALDGLETLRAGLDPSIVATSTLESLKGDLQLPRDALDRALAAPDLVVAVDGRSEHNFYAGFAGDLSDGGVFVATYEVLPEGHDLRVAIRLPKHPDIITRGVVTWTREANAGSGLSPGMGLALPDLEDDARRVIEEFMTHREPLFHEA